MRRLRASRLVAAPQALVWDLLVTVARWPRWGPSVRAVELDTERITLGSRGVVETVVGVRLPFEVTRFEPDRSWSWSVRGVQATDHAVETTATGTRVSFGVPWVAAPYLGVCAVALRRLERLAVQEIGP
ncbi:MAG: SRPBCC family protein [Acidimicrobiales bacterium]|nr:SRPBCC family protein [Acidimicrobiales bacterium]